MKRWQLIVLGMLALVLVGAGAAYVGAQFLAPHLNSNPQAPNSVASKDGNAPLQFQVDPAPEIPQSQPAVIGALVRRQDNSLFVGSGKRAEAVTDANGNVTVQHSFDTGTEIVVTHDTLVYRDVTQQHLDKNAQNGGHVQMFVEPGSADEIGVGTVVRVWGERSGERLLAKIVLYEIPSVLPEGFQK